jgi:hypothetical protein
VVLAPVVISGPVEGQLSLSSSVQVSFSIDARAVDSVTVRLDDQVITDSFDISAEGEGTATLTDVPPGQHLLVVEEVLGEETESAEVAFETEDLADPDDCEVFNNAECMLPYPSSRFLEDAETETGYHLQFPASGIPSQTNRPISPEPYAALDGFSPTVQILMHFPAGVHPELSGASRLLPETRSYGLRSLDPDSPTVLLDVDTGERVLHFIEVDARAEDKARQTLFLRPGRSLTPGHRYIVAVRDLVDAAGDPIEPEPAFAVLRDQRVTDIVALEDRREPMEEVFDDLEAAGVVRGALQLAFDFVVGSDEGLTGQMLAMRDVSFAWLLTADPAETFSVDLVDENDCTQPETRVWRVVEGSYRVPLFLEDDPVTNPDVPTFLNVDEEGVPVQNGFTNPPFTVGIPCSVLEEGDSVAYPVVLGHGLLVASSPTCAGSRRCRTACAKDS